ncbi:MAG TPA: GNAT family N-acetyltransferase [Solirubrobacterales bacterium]|jgi:CelD/BcsL family acetyltransferase involved in cellulose biosynthesis
MWEACAIDPISDPEWLVLLDESPGAEIFHHPAWLDLLRSQYGYAVGACCVRNGNGRLEAGIPIARIESRLTGRRLVSLPFSDVCAPALCRDAEPAALTALGAAMSAECRRTGLGLAVHASVPDAPEAFVQRRFVRHLLPLTDDPAELEQRYSKSTLRNVRKARREGLRLERHTDASALDAFYRLHLKTRRRLGVPTQPKRFIRRFEQLFSGGLGFVATVFDGPRLIAAAVFLTYDGTLTYKYGASDAGALAKRPNNLLFAETIRWACESGLRSVDFGRTDIDNEGLRAFKRSWGAQEVDQFYTYLHGAEPSPEQGRRERLVGAAIRHSPAGVGRLAGEALYRHFG